MKNFQFGNLFNFCFFEFYNLKKEIFFRFFLIINENSNGIFKANIGYFYESSLNEADN